MTAPVTAADADGLFECWQRPGIAHFRQPHNFLALARQVLLEQAPDVLGAILALGARENRQYELLPAEAQPGDETLVSICARRPLFEYALRQAVDADDNVQLETSSRVVALLPASRRTEGQLRISGVQSSEGREIEAELVVDALGRTSPLRSWLKALGARPLRERRSECGLIYYSRHFRLRDGAELPRSRFLLGGPRGEIGYLAFAVFVEDNRTFALILSIPPWDRELRVLKSEQAYMTAALSLPPLLPWLHPDQSQPITPVLPMGSLQNLHRSLVVEGEPSPSASSRSATRSATPTRPSPTAPRSRSSTASRSPRSRRARRTPARGRWPSMTRSARTPPPASMQSPPRTAIDCGSGKENRSTSATLATVSPCSSG